MVVTGSAMLALIGGADPGSLEAAGLTGPELDGLRVEGTGLRQRAQDVEASAQEEVERLAAEKAGAERKAKEKAERKEQQGVERKAEAAEREAQQAAQAVAEEDARRQQEQSQIQPFAPQLPLAPAPEPAPAPVAVPYPNCTAARAAGATPVYAGLRQALGSGRRRRRL